MRDESGTMTQAIVQVDAVHVLLESGVGMLAFEGISDGERVHLILSIDLDPVSGQPAKLGSMYFEWCDQPRSGYDLIRSTEWVGADLLMRTNAEAAAAGIPKDIRLQGVDRHLDIEGRARADLLLDLT